MGFFSESINFFLNQFSINSITLSNEILPIGLSFHTFQSVSYVIDVYRGKIKPEKHLGIYSTYVLFFPQMIAGPIERFSTLGNEIKKEIIFKTEFLKKALPIFFIGLFYKMVIADNCGEYVNYTYQTISSQNNFNVLIAIFLFCIQIYADFFGYSLMAQASAQLFGIKLIDNFSFPFFSKSIIDFWKKWHISLTNWFRDYVYIPLGGNRGSTIKYSFNIVTIFTLSGLWHGAGLNFILWGIIHSICYLLTLFLTHNIKVPLIMKYIFTFTLVSFIFVFFRAESLLDAINVFKNAFKLKANIQFTSISYILLANILIIFTIEFFAKKYINYQSFINNNTKFKNGLLFFYILFSLLTFSGVDNLPFIYFQF